MTRSTETIDRNLDERDHEPLDLHPQIKKQGSARSSTSRAHVTAAAAGAVRHRAARPLRPVDEVPLHRASTRWCGSCCSCCGSDTGFQAAVREEEFRVGRRTGGDARALRRHGPPGTRRPVAAVWSRCWCTAGEDVSGFGGKQFDGFRNRSGTGKRPGKSAPSRALENSTGQHLAAHSITGGVSSEEADAHPGPACWS